MENNPKCLYLLYIPCLHKNACPSLAIETRNNLSFTTSPWLPGCWGLFPLCFSHSLLVLSTSSQLSVSPSSPMSSTHWCKGLSYWSGGRMTPLHIRLLPLISSPVLKTQLLLPLTVPSIVAKWDEWKGKRAHNPSLIPHREGPWLYPQLSTERKVKRKEGGSWKLEAEERKEGIISCISSSSNWLLTPSASFMASLILFSPQSCSSSILQLSSGSCVPPLASNSGTLPEVSVFKNLQLSQQWIQVEETHICQP